MFCLFAARQVLHVLKDCKVLINSAGKQEYGTSTDDLQQVVAAQQKFKGNFPGPAPVLMLSKAVSCDDIKAAASAGFALFACSHAHLTCFCACTCPRREFFAFCSLTCRTFLWSNCSVHEFVMCAGPQLVIIRVSFLRSGGGALVGKSFCGGAHSTRQGVSA